MKPHPEQRDGARLAFLDGARQSRILAPTYLPFGMVCGVAAVQAGLGEWGAVALAALAFAGSAQAVLTQFIQAGAPLAVAILSGLIVNLRMAVYSAALAPRLGHAPLRQRLLWATFLVDQTYLSEEARHARGAHRDHALAFYLGGAAVLWPTWLAANAFGAFAGARVPPAWQLEFTIPLTFVALVVPLLRDASERLTAGVGAVAGVLLFALPLKLGLIVASLVAVLAGLGLDALRRALVRDQPVDRG
ncbi:MAG: AzlC family ABC transporter permease [Casimicrobiaceae bacterium]|nr:AzlC family ABC transporter permease [Casimicrobiaceae bacterium]MDW8311516.1 AzlC family ABC transporter permease [Burkholderiales bacterium]